MKDNPYVNRSRIRRLVHSSKLQISAKAMERIEILVRQLVVRAGSKVITDGRSTIKERDINNLIPHVQMTFKKNGRRDPFDSIRQESYVTS